MTVIADSAEDLVFDKLLLAKELFPEQPPGFPFESCDIMDVILPKGDDLGIKSEDEDIGEADVRTESGFGSVVGECVGGGGSPACQIPAPEHLQSAFCINQSWCHPQWCPTCRWCLKKNMRSSLQ